MKSQSIALLALATMSTAAHAGDWTGTGELGLALARGNSESETANARVNVKKESDPWTFEGSAGVLRATGQDYAAPLAARFGIDITQPDFWRRSLVIVESQVQRFEGLGETR